MRHIHGCRVLALLTAAVGLMAVLVCGDSVQAGLSIEDQMVPPHHVRSSRSWAIEARGGAYRPRLTLGPPTFGEAAGPQHFVADRALLLPDLVVEHMLIAGPASVFLGGSLGYLGGEGVLWAKGPTGPLRESGWLTMVPIGVHATVRIDGLAREGHTLWVPYVRAGLVVTSFMIDTSSIQRRGSASGVQVTTGLALRLDTLDPHSARRLDEQAGINHTSLFLEATRHMVEGFEATISSGHLDLVFAGGLSFEM